MSATRTCVILSAECTYAFRQSLMGTFMQKHGFQLLSIGGPLYALSQEILRVERGTFLPLREFWVPESRCEVLVPNHETPLTPQQYAWSVVYKDIVGPVFGREFLAKRLLAQLGPDTSKWPDRVLVTDASPRTKDQEIVETAFTDADYIVRVFSDPRH